MCDFVGWRALAGHSNGSPRLSLLAAGLGALVVVEVLLGTLNLRGLVVERQIDGEVFAQLPVQSLEGSKSASFGFCLGRVDFGGTHP